MFKNLLSKLWPSKGKAPIETKMNNVDHQDLREEISELIEVGPVVDSTSELSVEPIRVEAIDNKSVVDNLVAEGRLEIIHGDNNSMTIRKLGEITHDEFKALDRYINVDIPMLSSSNAKNKSKGSTNRPKSGHGLAVDEPYKKLNYSTEFIDYSKKGNPLNAVSMFLKPEPMFKSIIADYAQRVSKATKILLPDDGEIIDVNVKGTSLKEQYQPYIQHFKLPYENVAFEINYRPNDDDFDESIVPSIPMILLCEESNHSIDVTIFYRNVEGFWIVVNESPIILKNDFSKPLVVIKDADIFNQADDDVRGAFSNFTDIASKLIYEFLCAINCSNINASEEIKAAKFANQKRKEKGKAPLFDYKVLVLDFAGSKTNDSQGGQKTHTNKRPHLRRGHIRRLKHKTVWVNACAVGGRGDGKIEKDYEIRKPVTISKG